MPTQRSLKRKAKNTVELEYEDDDEGSDFEDTKTKSIPSKKAKRTKKESKQVKFEPPSNWKEELDLIREMRKKRDAPVDVLGSEALPEKNVDDKTYRYQCLISVMLSSQTKDEITGGAIKRLQALGLNMKTIQNTDEQTIMDIIKPVGFYKKKAVYIKKTTAILLSEYDGDIPRTIAGLISLPGVGPKMAYIAMRNAWNISEGIGIDVHLHAICNRLKWSKSKTPEETRVQLESWLPKEEWDEVNLLLVGFGQQICSSRPKCEQCLLHNICSSSLYKDSKQKNKKSIKTEVKEEIKENKNNNNNIKEEIKENNKNNIKEEINVKSEQSFDTMINQYRNEI